MQDYDFIHRVVVAGPSSVGKSALLRRYADNQFENEMLPTIGVDFKIKTVEAAGKVVKLQIWDTAGQERFRSIAASYYRGAGCILLVFDLTDASSLNRIAQTIEEVSRHVEFSPDLDVVVVGNKADLGAERRVAFDEAQAFARQYGFRYKQTSASTGSGIQKLFDELVVQAVKKHRHRDSKVRQQRIFIDKLEKRKPLLEQVRELFSSCFR